MNDQLSALGALADGDGIDLDNIDLSIDDLLGNIQTVHVGD